MTLAILLCGTLCIQNAHSQSQLDEQVPYQGDTLLTNPNQYRVTSEGDVLMDCDWPTMIAMIRDLEERIAGETETDTTYGVYVSGVINGNDLNMWYDCLVLRDSILSLQVAYDESLAPRVTVDAAVVLSDTSAALSASFSGSGVDASGFAWAEDYTTTPQTGIDTGTSSPIADTLTTLDAGTFYYFSAYASKDGELFYGDTLSFLTLPGITTDAADDLSAESAILNATFSADSITAQGFVWGLQSDLSDGTNVSADTTGGSTAIEYALTGLTEDATYYFSAYATNASGTTYGDTLSFSTVTPPTMTITAAEVANGDCSADASLTLTFTSSESTSDFVEADISLTNGTLSGFTAASGAIYIATFTPTNSGPCTINVAGSTFTGTANGVNNAAAMEFYWGYRMACAMVSSSSDDVEYTQVDGLYEDSSDLELVNDGDDQQVVGVRFAQVTIPQGATVISAYIQFTTDEADTEPTSVNIAVQDAANNDTFTGNENISSRPTFGSVSWDNIPGWTVVHESGDDQRTPDLSSLVQEIVTKADWSSNNAMTFIITGTGQRTAESYDGDPSKAPRLEITWQP